MSRDEAAERYYRPQQPINYPGGRVSPNNAANQDHSMPPPPLPPKALEYWINQRKFSSWSSLEAPMPGSDSHVEECSTVELEICHMLEGAEGSEGLHSRVVLRHPQEAARAGLNTVRAATSVEKMELELDDGQWLSSSELDIPRSLRDLILSYADFLLLHRKLASGSGFPDNLDLGLVIFVDEAKFVAATTIGRRHRYLLDKGPTAQTVIGACVGLVKELARAVDEVVRVDIKKLRSLERGVGRVRLRQACIGPAG